MIDSPNCAGAIAEFRKRHKNRPEGTLSMLLTDSKRLATATARSMENDEGEKVLLITQDTMGEALVQLYMASKGAVNPQLIEQGYTAIITSPSVREGLSIEQYTDLISSVWSINTGGSIGAAAIAQTLDRLRSICQRFLYLPETGKGFNKITQATTPAQARQDLELSKKPLASQVRRSLQPDITQVTDAIDWYSQDVNMWAALVAQHNAGVWKLKETVLGLLRNEGKIITPYTLTVSAADIATSDKAFKAARLKIREEYETAVASAIDISE
ncbi:MAG TPA: hypothetical protein V6D20_04985, partial [Candidatus Obscuribacterales bacterium]